MLGLSHEALRQGAIVVPVEFWPCACVSGVRTLPHLVRWHEKYASQGLVVLGVHAPEFAFERAPAKLQAALQRHGIRYPVAQDNALKTWAAWRSAYWAQLDRQPPLFQRSSGFLATSPFLMQMASETERPTTLNEPPTKQL